MRFSPASGYQAKLNPRMRGSAFPEHHRIQSPFIKTQPLGTCFSPFPEHHEKQINFSTPGKHPELLSEARKLLRHTKKGIEVESLSASLPDSLRLISRDAPGANRRLRVK
jgi:hypothetical protein